MCNIYYVPHNAISSSRYSIREFNTGTEPFMVAMIMIIIIIIPSPPRILNQLQVREHNLLPRRH